ncbi:MAG: hypothetical protein ACOCYU_06975 [Brevefilum sp.]
MLITHGAQGACAFTRDVGWHIPVPDVPVTSNAESMGCGDQVLAVLCAQAPRSLI